MANSILDLSECELETLEQGLYEIENQPEMFGEIATHSLLLAMDDDELFHHLKDPAVMNKFIKAQRQVMSECKAGVPWGSIYE
ncbi:coil containing protein [Vibrio phage 1.049.O._10N.286.54.B5]|nr:coil containing protein [Vibrio phage 1.049.O._10N.286.54.B5]AUR84200.1 coil containing protein [Vibrio phage 1.050.O._10N.286.48.A6]